MKFYEFNFEDKLLDGLDAMGFEKATPIQEEAIPIIMEGHDLIACAQTGTGKTAAFLLPILNRIVKSKNPKLNTLIIAPTRELAIQIDQQIVGLSYFLGISSIPVYGGGDGDTFVQQRRALMEGAEVVVATPGRLISLLNSGMVDFKHLQHLILDEADRMLDMGFYNDIMRIVGYLPEKKQSLLFSATMPTKIRQLASKILNNPKQINIAISKPAEGIDQQAYIVHDDQKVELTASILANGNYQTVVIFAGRKESVRQLEKDLKRKGMSVKGFQSDLEQAEREEIMLAFKNKQLRILVATDIISRGIDVDGIDLVVNYDVPPDPEDYIHRIGRTARAETTGTAITFVGPRDQRRFKSIEDFLEREIPKKDLPEGFAPGPPYDPSKRSEGGGFGRNKGRNGDRGKRFSNKPRTSVPRSGGGGGNRNSSEGSNGERPKRPFNKRRNDNPNKPSGGGEGGSTPS